jgi:hypothetical protein
MEEMEISSPSNSRKRRDNPTENDEIDNNRSVKRNRTRTMPEGLMDKIIIYMQI